MLPLALLAALLTADPPDVRWPLWPSAVAVDAAALDGGPGVPESRRLAALRALDAYPNALIADRVAAALLDPSPQIRREALQRCANRGIAACVPAALRIWRDPSGELSGRLYALRVLAGDPAPESHARVVAALRVSANPLRAEAARLLGVIRHPPGADAEVRAALVAKLADAAPEVRRAAARSLGLLGAAEGALVLARMLDDPDPQVRRDIAEALGMLHDPRTAPALLRTLERGDEAYIARAYLHAYARFPGPEVDARLLDLLDAPPRGLTSKQIARELGLRAPISAAALDGLLARLREDALRAPVLDALLALGDQALPALRAALRRGVEAPLAVELERLVRARELSALQAPATPPLPADDDPPAWAALLGGDAPLPAAAALAERAPPWLAAAAAAVLEGPAAADRWRPWALALTLAPDAGAAPPLLAPRLAALARDPHLAAGDRCLALAAHAAVAPPATRRARAPRDAPPAPLDAAASDRAPALRACAAILLGAHPRALSTPRRAAAAAPHLAALLHDPSPRVRAAAALALAGATQPLALRLRAHLALLAARDRDPRVRAAAALALTTLRAAPPRRPPRLAWVTGPSAPEGPGWLALTTLRVPAFRVADPAAAPAVWALLPNLPALPRELAPAPSAALKTEDDLVD